MTEQVRPYPQVMTHMMVHDRSQSDGFYITSVEQKRGQCHPVYIARGMKPGVYPLCVPVQPRTSVRTIGASVEPAGDVGWAAPWPTDTWPLDAEWGWTTVIALDDGVRYSINPEAGHVVEYEYGEKNHDVKAGWYIFFAEDGTIDKPILEFADADEGDEDTEPDTVWEETEFEERTLLKVSSEYVRVNGKHVAFRVHKTGDN